MHALIVVAHPEPQSFNATSPARRPTPGARAAMP